MRAPVRHCIELDAVRELHPCFRLVESGVKFFVVPLLLIKALPKIAKFREVLKLVRFDQSGTIPLNR